MLNNISFTDVKKPLDFFNGFFMFKFSVKIGSKPDHGGGSTHN